MSRLKRREESMERSSATTRRTRHHVQWFIYFTDATDYGAAVGSPTGNKLPGVRRGAWILDGVLRASQEQAKRCSPGLMRAVALPYRMLHPQFD